MYVMHTDRAWKPKGYDSAKACRDYRAAIPFHTPNAADQPVTLLTYRPSSARFVPPQINRKLQNNKLTTLEKGVFSVLGSLDRL